MSQINNVISFRPTVSKKLDNRHVLSFSENFYNIDQDESLYVSSTPLQEGALLRKELRFKNIREHNRSQLHINDLDPTIYNRFLLRRRVRLSGFEPANSRSAKLIRKIRSNQERAAKRAKPPYSRYTAMLSRHPKKHKRIEKKKSNKLNYNKYFFQYYSLSRRNTTKTPRFESEYTRLSTIPRTNLIRYHRLYIPRDRYRYNDKYNKHYSRGRYIKYMYVNSKNRLPKKIVRSRRYHMRNSEYKNVLYSRESPKKGFGSYHKVRRLLRVKTKYNPIVLDKGVEKYNLLRLFARKARASARRVIYARKFCVMMVPKKKAKDATTRHIVVY